MVFIVIAGAFIILVFFNYKNDLTETYQYAGRKAAPIKSAVLPVPQRYKEILQKYFQFYQKLSSENKAKFEHKVCNFVYGKHFIPRNIDEVTLEAKVLIAASAVQLTFGLPHIYLRHFNKILVYPNDYYSSITKQYHKGEVNPMHRVIVLSWQSFVDGYINPTDSKNLGLHEMGHALRLENIIRNDEYQFFDEALLDRFDEIARTVCMTQYPDKMFFRPYACTNEQEFFAVAVENFFERPVEFKNELPELYQILARLLNLDPISLTHSTN